MEFKFTPHAIEEMHERGIPLHIVMIVLETPDEIVSVHTDRNAYQAEVEINGKIYIVRVIVEQDGTVVTLYRTSNVKKYRGES